jgi:sodium transport system permease protein
MFWSNVKLIFLRELRDQLRDRRTLFAVVVLPLLLYPLLGVLIFQVQQFLKEHTSKIRIVATTELPNQPRLLDSGKLAAEYGNTHQIAIEVVPNVHKSFDELKVYSQADIQLGLYDAVVYFPPDFAQQIERIRAGESNSPETQIIFDAARDKSRVAKQRIESVLLHWRNSLGESNLQASNLSAVAARPFDLKQTDVAPAVRRRAALWSKILPFIVMIWALTGAFYPAVDLCAGEKERGTLETLLTSPAARQEIVCGKLLTVMTFSIATAVLNLASMMATGAFIFSQIQRMGAARIPLDVAAPPVTALLWLLLALVPISALFSALALAIAAFARSSKEGHYYLVPLLMMSLPLMMLSIVPGAELDLGFALIPLTGVLLWLRALIEGQYLDVLRFSVPVLGMTTLCCFFAIRWAVAQFNNESVLFRESERFDLVLWLRHLRRNRAPLPTAGQAALLALIILLARFTFSLAAPQPTSWSVLATTTLIMLIAFVAAPACLMAIFFTRRPFQTLLLRPPAFSAAIPVAALLAAALHPLLLWLNQGIAWLYPLNPLAAAKLGEIEAMFLSAPLWQALAVICVAPAICEELAFRGFILSGLRQTGREWTAILTTSAVFGLAHGILQQSLGAAVIGVVIGFIAVKTGSLWPGVAYHTAHNGLSVCVGRLTPETIDSHSLMRLLFDSTPDGQIIYHWSAALAAGAIALGLLWWLKSLPSAAKTEIPAPSWAPTTWYKRPIQSRLDHQHDAA